MEIFSHRFCLTGTDLKAAFLEQHHGRVVDAGAFRKDEYRQFGGIVDVFLQPRPQVDP